MASQAAGYAQNFNGMSGVTQAVPWTDLDRNGTILDAAGNIEVNEVGARPPNYGQVTVRPDPALARGYNWEYSAVLQHELDAAHIGDGGASITAISTTCRCSTIRT